MKIESSKNQVIFRFTNKLNVTDLQDVADFLEYKSITKKSQATQEEVDILVKTIKKGRWARTKQELNL